jgi:hypothetical protein
VSGQDTGTLHDASRGTVGDVSTRMLILSALACGMGLLVAFTVQVVMAS